jgi:hypothetical protein
MLYLDTLSGYFKADPYSSWFNRSFEPLLLGVGGSYYSGKGSIALHTDIASPIATRETWSKLDSKQRYLHRGGADLWRDLVETLSPNVIIVSVAQEHLSTITKQPFRSWEELTRIERQHPFIVCETTTVLGSRKVLVVHGRCTNVPFGSIKFQERKQIGVRIADRIYELRLPASRRTGQI